jgi:hypothetical protein
LPKAIFSAGVAANNALAFPLAHLEAGMAVEIRNRRGEVLLCGRLLHYMRTEDFVEAETGADPEHMPDCRADHRVKKKIFMDDMEFAEVVSPTAEFYAYDQGRWFPLRWRKPIKRDTAPFAESGAVPPHWRRYTRPPKAVPGVFWPEVRVLGGVYSMTRTRDAGVPVSFALDYRMHRALYALGLYLEAAYFLRLVNGDVGLVSPERFFAARGGISFAFLQRPFWSAAVLANGGVVNYVTGSAESGLRPVAGLGFLFSWHILRNNRDSHKISLVLEPTAAMIFNRENVASTSPWLFELKAGLQYAY